MICKKYDARHYSSALQNCALKYRFETLLYGWRFCSFLLFVILCWCVWRGLWGFLAGGAYLSFFWKQTEWFDVFLRELPIFVEKVFGFVWGIFNEYGRMVNGLDLFGACSGCFGKFGGCVLPELNGIIGFAQVCLTLVG